MASLPAAMSTIEGLVKTNRHTLVSAYRLHGHLRQHYISITCKSMVRWFASLFGSKQKLVNECNFLSNKGQHRFSFKGTTWLRMSFIGWVVEVMAVGSVYKHAVTELAP